MKTRQCAFLLWTALLTSGVLMGQPVISAISPTSQVAGTPFDLIVAGSGLCSGTSIRFNGTLLSASYSAEPSPTVTTTISGALTNGLSGPVPVQVVNPVGNSFCSFPGQSSTAVDFNVIPKAILLQPSSLPDGFTGINYSQLITASGGTSPYTFSTTGPLPPGLTLASGGGLTGVPTTTGSYSFTVFARDVQGQSGGLLYTIVVQQGLAIVTSTLPGAQLNQPYSFSVSASGGTPPYVWSQLNVGAPGITLSSAGVLSGTPVQAGTFDVQIRVRDAHNQISKTLQLTVGGSALQIITSTLPAATVNLSYSTSLAATGGSPPYTWSTQSALPAGVALASNGILSGVPTQSGSFPLQVIVRDTLNRQVSANLTLIVGAPLQITPSLPNGNLNVPYSATLQATGGTQPYTWQLSNSAPPGLTVASNGVVSGTPTQAGTFTLNLLLHDSLGTGTSGSVQLVIQNSNLQITTTFLPAANLNAAYSANFAASGGTQPYSWTLLGGAPPGLQLSSAGLLSGAATQVGNFNVQVRVTDSANNQISTSVPLTVQNSLLQIITTSLPSVSLGVSYTTTLSATGGTLPYTWSTSSALPLGLSLASNGVLSGVTQQSGNFPVTIVVHDSSQQFASQIYTLVVGSSLQILTSTLPQGSLNVLYSTTFSATGGVTPYTWTAPGGTPPGLFLDTNSGVLSGTPVQEGLFNFNVQVRDASNQIQLRSFSLAVGNVLNIMNASLKNGIVNTFYEEIFSAAGGTIPYQWTLQSSPPPGLSLNPLSGQLNGTPTLAGTFNVTVKVTDANGLFATRSYSVTINPSFSITNETLPVATVGANYDLTFNAAGGTAPYFWSLTGSPIPGLTLNIITGSLNGIPTTAGTFNFTIIATDSFGLTAQKQFTLTVGQGLRISPDTIPNATVGIAYQQTFSAAGGTTPYSFTITGNVPGLALDPATGVFRGMPTQAGTYNFTIRGTDVSNLAGTRSYTLTVIANLLITTTSLPDAVSGVSYTQSLAASGGVVPYSWRISTGILPEGLSLNASTGGITGTPARSGSENFTVEVTDNAGLKATQGLSLNVLAGIAIQTAGTLPAGVIGSSYSTTLLATGGNAPYTWSIKAGALPDGLLLVPASGFINGNPTRLGRFTFTLEVTDGSARTNSAEAIININPSLLRITSGDSLPATIAGGDFQFQPAVTGGIPPYRWSLNGAPTGIVIDETTGAITGRLMTPGNTTFSIRVVDGNNTSATQSVTLNVNLPTNPGVNITGLPPTGNPGQQASPRVSIAQPYPLPISGEALLTFNSAAVVDDPAIQFSTGGRRAAFNIPAGQTDAVFTGNALGIQTGTVAGTIVVSATLNAAGQDITPSPAPSFTVQIPRQSPVINSVRLNRTTAGFELVITGFSTAREINSAAIRLTTTGTVQGTDFTVNVQSAVAAWYQTADSRQFGSLCTITVPFTVQQGSTGAISSASVTLTNSIGTSAAATVNF